MRRIFLLVAIAALLCSSCASSPAASDEDLVAAVAAQASATSADPLQLIDETCRAQVIVDALGGAAAIEDQLDVTVESVEAGADLYALAALDQAEAEAVTDIAWTCGDYKAGFLNDVLGGGVTEDQLRCFVDLTDSQLVKDMAVAKLMGEAGTEKLAEAVNNFFQPSMTAMDDCEFP